jgi:hypothetical protein
VVSADKPTEQSPAIDRIVFDRAASMPLVSAPEHSIFPIEAVAGMVQITLRLDATKLADDIKAMHPIKAMTNRRYLAPDPTSGIKVIRRIEECLSPRSFIIGQPADPKWDPRTIIEALQRIQRGLGLPTHVHGLYVLGVGVFFTRSVGPKAPQPYDIDGCIGPDRIFRFAHTFRGSFDRWRRPPAGWSVDLTGYIPGGATISTS